MSTTGFPEDDYTPHGYLANPHAVAHSWTDGEGGCLRSSRDYVGLGWVLPWSQNARAYVELIVALRRGDEVMVRRADFATAGLYSPHHSSRLLVYRWQAFDRTCEARYTLVGKNELGLEVAWTANRTGEGNDTSVVLLMRGSYLPDADQPQGLMEFRAPWMGELVGTLTYSEPFGEFELRVSSQQPWLYMSPDDISMVTGTPGVPSDSDEIIGVVGALLPIGGEASDKAYAVLRRLSIQDSTGNVAQRVPEAVERARVEDDAFWSNSARLEGDWPASWRRGWVYDLETTRMCVYPPGGIFTDVWPAWMVQWPRAVVAEGTLDMVRLAYVAPDLAKRAILSLFRDAEAPNVPCVFQHGEPNMVAADGSICGTSPAWCVPFYNLERLYALTGDRAWLERLYPYLGRYVEWWLAERTDPEGWAVYKCTWEAGEDDTPRLDPERRGDNVVSSFVRPVELQATMALSAGVLARFAESLGRPDDARRWQLVEADFAGRTQTLWDEAEGRFRDWDARAGTFLAPASQPNYWDIDPCRYSALAFTPVLAGIASSEQQGRLHDELRHYAVPPWTLWASWSYVVLEAAMLAGARELAGRVAHEIVGRVYAELDARDIASPKHPTPGVAREYWPLDLDAWEACEGYGWGANTASLLMRQIFGFLEQPPDASGALSFRLWPQLPTDLCRPGAVFRVRSLPYRGQSLTLAYQTAGDLSPTELTVTVEADVALACRVVGAGGEVIYASASPTRRHAFPGRNGEAFDVTLTAPT